MHAVSLFLDFSVATFENEDIKDSCIFRLISSIISHNALQV